MTKDPEDLKTAYGEEEDDEDEAKLPQLSFLTVAHLNSNESLIRSRILTSLRCAPDHTLPHSELTSAMVGPSVYSLAFPLS